jgi:hypothetical protein
MRLNLSHRMATQRVRSLRPAVRRVGIPAILLLSLLLAERTLSAQQADLREGERVRLIIAGSDPSLWHFGFVWDIGADSIRVLGRDSLQAVAFESVLMLQRSAGIRRHGGSGAAIGGLAGGILHGLYRVATARDSGISASDTFVVASIFGAMFGVVPGYLLGMNHATERWVDVPLSP